VKLILASSSPRRRSLLKTLGVPFTVKASHVREDSKQIAPGKLVEELALRKAVATAAALKKAEQWVLGADTVVVLGRYVVSKPSDANDAYRMLYRLSGSIHRVYTGIALVEAGGKRRWVSHAVSSVRMKKMPIDDILRLSRKHMDKAGAYAIQDKDPYAKVVAGEYENVMGLPLGITAALLRKAGFKVRKL
jgi:septum formation protein